MLFFHLLDSSKTAARGEAGFVGRHSGGEGVALGQFQVSAHFVLQFLVKTPLSQQRQQTLERES
jgi:hypothetical protein